MTEQNLKTSRTEIVRAQVQGWLMEEGWHVGQQQSPGVEWAVTGVDPTGRHILIAQRSDALDRIVIQGSITVAQEHQQQITRLPALVRHEMLWDLRLRLLQANIEFQGVDDQLTQIGVAQRMYFDGLSKDAFLQRVSQVRNAVLMVIWSIQRTLTRPTDGAQMGFRVQSGGGGNP